VIEQFYHENNRLTLLGTLTHDELDNNRLVVELIVGLAHVGEYNRITFANNFALILVLEQVDTSVKRDLAGPQLDGGVAMSDCVDRASRQELAYLRPDAPWM